MASIDLKDAYLLVPVHKNFQKYLRFSFDGKLYEFLCLPFGLCTASFLFTKLTKPIIHQLRSRGFLSVIYLDDILLIGKSKEDCLKNVHETKVLFESLGFILNFEKCNLIPSMKCKYLGFIFDSVNLTVELTSKKRELIVNLSEKFKRKKKFKIRMLAQFLGILISACPGVNYGFLYTKNFEREKFLALESSGGNYEQSMCLSENVTSDLDWWIERIPKTCNPIRQFKFSIEIFSDASLSGWGISCINGKSHGWWNEKDKNQHINYLELKAAFYALKCYAANLESREILLRIDNTTAISYINKMGSVKFPNLTALCKKIRQWCEARDLWIFASYVSSKENVDADSESRSISLDTEWELDNKAFNHIVDFFGAPEIDLFASNINSKCPKFVSWHKDPEALAVDAFTINWTDLNFYAFPPFSIISRVLQKIITDKASGLVVVPNWPTQPWFPLFNKLLLTNPIILNERENLLKSPFRNQRPLKTSLVVGKLSGERIF